MDTELRICADLILLPGALACLRSPKARYKASDCTWASLLPPALHTTLQTRPALLTGFQHLASASFVLLPETLSLQ